MAMAAASEYFVTPDSITMICEACASNRPVKVFDLECYNSETSTARFVGEFIRDQQIEKFGTPENGGAMIPRESHTEQISSKVAEKYNEWYSRKSMMSET